MAFSRKRLGFKVQLGKGSYGADGFETVDVPEGLWATARITKAGSPTYNEADVTIAGLDLSLMNRLSRVGLQPDAVRNNIVTVTAADGDDDEMTSVFVGVIKEAWPDFADPASPVFRINANTGLYWALKPIRPMSYNGATDVVDIMRKLAGEMGYTLENNGVQGVKLSSPYLAGSPRSMAISVAEAAGIYVYFEDDNGAMAICPMRGSRDTPVPTIGPGAGLVGYPSYVGPGLISVVAEFNPLLRLLGNVKIENSAVQGANGTWRVIALSHDLSTRPDGPWFSHLRGNNYNQQGSK